MRPHPLADGHRQPPPVGVRGRQHDEDAEPGTPPRRATIAPGGAAL
ncbi:MAG TPA: hypothetical protein VI248_11725 [Kineosporiaceae bacterium]